MGGTALVAVVVAAEQVRYLMARLLSIVRHCCCMRVDRWCTSASCDYCFVYVLLYTVHVVDSVDLSPESVDPPPMRLLLLAVLVA